MAKVILATDLEKNMLALLRIEPMTLVCDASMPTTDISFPHDKDNHLLVPYIMVFQFSVNQKYSTSYEINFKTYK